MNALDSIFWYENQADVRDVALWASSPDSGPLIDSLAQLRDFIERPALYPEYRQAYEAWVVDNWTPEVPV